MNPGAAVTRSDSHQGCGIPREAPRPPEAIVLSGDRNEEHDRGAVLSSQVRVGGQSDEAYPERGDLRCSMGRPMDTDLGLMMVKSPRPVSLPGGLRPGWQDIDFNSTIIR